jgi:hypothetical protein
MDLRQGLLAIVAASLSPLAANAASGRCKSLDECMAAVVATEDARAAYALQRIPDIGAKLLALHSYLRAGPQLAKRWSWTETQISEFAGSTHEAQLAAAIRLVRREFEQRNPGCTLTVNPEVRSLDRQLTAWNSNHSVAAAAQEFAAAAVREVASPGDAGNAGVAPAEFARFVMDYKPRPSPTLAAPGLSRHGQMYAVDFHVRKEGEVVADTDSGSIAQVWVGQGWEQRLRTAVAASGAPFIGPLQDPHEPWHYDYDPPESAQPAPR